MKKPLFYSIVIISIALILGAIYLSFRSNKGVKKNIFNYYQVLEEEKQELLKSSKSQIQQDIFVYLELGKKRKGFFVEFGAADGIGISNSYMLEQQFGWHGILAEPAVVWHEQLKNNRHKSIIETMCVWKETGKKLIFNETTAPELSTINEFSKHDKHNRQNSKTYEVSTISLLDLLKKHHAPKYIDYLSIDTEGSELDILQAYFRDNKYYKIKIITCEHNFTKNRKKIYKLLINNGYIRKHKSISKCDDFYVLQDRK